MVFSIFFRWSLFGPIYILSDAVYGLLYYIIGYRKEVVMKNLLIAFPEKDR